MHGGPLDAPDEIDSADEVSPLIVPAGLQGAAVAAEEFEVILGLEQLVAELGEGHSLVALQPACHGVPRQHGAEAEMLADVAQEIERTEIGGPVEVVDEDRRVVPGEVEEL